MPTSSDASFTHNSKMADGYWKYYNFATENDIKVILVAVAMF